MKSKKIRVCVIIYKMYNQVQNMKINSAKQVILGSLPEKSNNRNTKIKSAIGSVAGTIIPLAIMMKNRRITNPLKLEYGLKDMVILSGSSVLGGVTAGFIGSDKKSRKNKVKEGVFQFFNAAIPTWMAGGALKICETSKTKFFKTIPFKLFSVGIGLIVGMLGAAEFSNLLFDPHDKEPDRKITLKDCFVNADDALGALVLAKFPLVEKLHLEKLLPLIYTYCGYRAGKAE